MSIQELTVGLGEPLTPSVRALLDAKTAEIERLEKERFKYETALMLIGKGYPGAVELANAAIAKTEPV